MATTDTAPEHSKFSPSHAHSWTDCTAQIGYVAANRDRIPPERVSPAAIEGTKAHTVAENTLLGKPLPAYATKDMIHFGKEYAAFARELMGPKAQLYDWGVEHRAPLYYRRKDRGTIDFFCYNLKGVHILDLKYGFDPVDSVKNKQMAIYARNIIEEMVADLMWSVKDDTPVTMTIYQPRLSSEPMTWTVTWKELVSFTLDEVTLPYMAIISGASVKFSPSEKTCKYCPAKSFCEARTASMLGDFSEIIPFVSKDKPLPEWSRISEQRLVEIYNNRGVLSQWLGDIAKHVESMVLSGKRVPGLKTVLSQGPHRRWTDQPKAEAILNELGIPWDESHSVDFVTPAQAEKLVHAKKGKRVIELSKLMHKPAGQPIVVKESDPRPAHKEDVAGDFDEIVNDWLD